MQHFHPFALHVFKSCSICNKKKPKQKKLQPNTSLVKQPSKKKKSTLLQEHQNWDRKNKNHQNQEKSLEWRGENQKLQLNAAECWFTHSQLLKLFKWTKGLQFSDGNKSSFSWGRLLEFALFEQLTQEVISKNTSSECIHRHIYSIQERGNAFPSWQQGKHRTTGLPLPARTRVKICCSINWLLHYF